MAQKSFRFNFWTDLDRERVQEYAKLLNSYYDGLKGFFQIGKTELGIRVVLFSKRSDYLNFYQAAVGKSGEHTSGFFSYNQYLSLLCFCDDPYDEETVFNTAKHECTHLLGKQCLPGARLPNWFDEGLACFYAGNGLEWSGDYPASCYLKVHNAMRNNRVVTLAELMDTPYSEFTFKHYAMSWSWLCFIYSKPELQKNLGRLFIQLRQMAKSEKDRKWDEVTNDLFRSKVGPPEKLQPAWDLYVKNDLLPLTAVQRYYCAEGIFDRVSNGWGFDPPLESHEKREMVRQGEGWLREALSTEEETLKARCRLSKVSALFARSRSMKYDLRETSLAAAWAAEILGAFTKESAYASLAYQAGYAAHRSLTSIWNAGDFENEEGTTCDFLSLLDKRIKALDDDDSPSHELRSESALLHLQKQVVEILIAEARTAYCQVLAQDPAHRRAARMWLYLALDFIPSDLENVFPHLLFQVQLDPDDFNLAALAAAYGGAGKKDYARTLLQRAYRITPNKKSLKKLAYYAGEE